MVSDARGWCGFHAARTDPREDIALIHDRRTVIPERLEWSARSEKIDNDRDLLLALRAGSLSVEQVR
jgi:putative SOS response-associated peptidase YedK